MPNPKVSIIMATYNRPQFIADALKSAFGQTFADWELIISDDSETDATATIVKGFESDSRVHYFHRPQKGTIGNSSNFALGKAKGEYAAILDDDDWWRDTEKLAKQVTFLDAHPDYAGCGGGIVTVDESGTEKSKVLKPETDEAIRRVALFANPMANSTTMFRTEISRAVGGYDETLPQLADWDFWLKIGTKGKLYNFPEYFLSYRIWGEGSSFKYQIPIVDAGYRIIKRHKNDYPGYATGIILNRIYWVYARFPASLRRFMNGFLSNLKKKIFSR